MKFILLGTAGCHLCDEAEALINTSLQVADDIKVDLFDIAEHQQWQNQYALRIPVLLHVESSQSLAWPFTETDIVHFVNTIKP